VRFNDNSEVACSFRGNRVDLHSIVPVALCLLVLRSQLLRQLQALSQRRNVQQQRPGQLHVSLSAGIFGHQLRDHHRRLHPRTLPERRHLRRTCTYLSITQTVQQSSGAGDKAESGGGAADPLKFGAEVRNYTWRL